METEEKKLGWKKIILIVFGVFLFVFFLICLYSHMIATSGLIIKEYKISNEKLPSHFYGFKIVHISDIHYGRTVKEKELQNIIKQINILKPDIVIFSGDLLDDTVSLNKNDIDIISKLLESIEAKIGKFAISGEQDVKEEWSIIINNSHFTNLNDNYELIYKDGYEPILLAGLSSNLKENQLEEKIKPIQSYLLSLKESEEIIPKYKILVIHEPDSIEQIDYENYDLVLAGHSHNGQIRLPFIGAISTFEGSKIYYDEYYKLNQTDFYISSGLGTSHYDFRLFNRPSFNFYRMVDK